ncbi:hypothetical protein K438DRAFT_1986666 [Mycena galopus ATCC 62051]|nr:hypothetical protein K438DRAFT_1986666 [Mycena galopus ATCC 62051]
MPASSTLHLLVASPLNAGPRRRLNLCTLPPQHGARHVTARLATSITTLIATSPRRLGPHPRGHAHAPPHVESRLASAQHRTHHSHPRRSRRRRIDSCMRADVLLTRDETPATPNPTSTLHPSAAPLEPTTLSHHDPWVRSSASSSSPTTPARAPARPGAHPLLQLLSPPSLSPRLELDEVLLHLHRGLRSR